MDDDALASLIAGDDTAAAPEAAEGLVAGPEASPAEGSQEEAGRMPALRDEPAAEPPPTAEAPPEAGQIPIGALLEEREKRQGLERRLAEIEAAQRASQAQAEQAQLPPEQAQQLQLWALRRDMSREMLATKHGEDEAKALEAWGFARCEQDPHFNAQVYQAKNPYEFIRQARQREQLLAEVSPDDLADYRAWKVSRAAPPAAQSPPPPRSLVTAPNAGGAGARAETPMGPGAAFASAIRR